MNKQSNDMHTPLLLHAARLVFPPLAALVVLVLTEWIARGTLDADTFAQYIGPHWEAYALAWALLFLVWLTVDWLTRFSPLATLVTAILGCVPAAVDFYTLQLRGEPFLPWDLMQVSEAAGVASAAGTRSMDWPCCSAFWASCFIRVDLPQPGPLLMRYICIPGSRRRGSK